jgi:ribosome-associated protein
LGRKAGQTNFGATPGATIAESEIEERFIHSAGPGGQNVNKVATAVQLRFDVRASTSLAEAVKQKLFRLAGHRISKDGVLVITARRFRSQERNREDARERLIALIRSARHEPRQRRPTKPSRAANEQRLERKKKHSALKKRRARPVPD